MSVTSLHVVDDRGSVDPDPAYEIHRRGLLFVTLGVLCLALGAGFAVLALEGEGPRWWYGVAAALVVLGGVHLAATADARTPVLVADDLGLRLRQRRSWVGLPWREVGDLRVEPRHGLLRDPHVKVVTRQGERVFTVPLGLAMSSSPAAAQDRLARLRRTASY